MLVKFFCMLAKSFFFGEIFMLVNDVGEVCMLVKILIVENHLIWSLLSIYLNRSRTVPFEPSSEVVVTLTLIWSLLYLRTDPSPNLKLIKILIKKWLIFEFSQPLLRSYPHIHKKNMFVYFQF